VRETRGENILVEFEIDKPIYLQAAILRFQYPFFDLEVKRSSHQPQKKVSIGMTEVISENTHLSLSTCASNYTSTKNQCVKHILRNSSEKYTYY